MARPHSSSPPVAPAALADMLRASEAVIEHAIQKKTEGKQRLQEGMGYAVLGGGKRIRSQLILATTAMLDAAQTKYATRVAASYECLHAYSLVHDDLPAMDDAQMRRGKPSCHIAFDEATAILIGDALQTLAFHILADPMTHPDAETRTRLILDLTTAAGVEGMAGGQMLDMLAVENDFDLATTRDLQAKKTGALIRAAMRAGGHITGSDGETLACLTAVGEAIGAAFQIADDVLDEVGEAATLGKPVSQDKPAHKATLVAHLGLEAAGEEARGLVASAEMHLGRVKEINPQADGVWGEYLSALFDYVVRREK